MRPGIGRGSIEDRQLVDVRAQVEGEHCPAGFRSVGHAGDIDASIEPAPEGSFPVSQSKSIEEFWRNSATTAAYSAALAPMVVQVDRYVAYTYGLFRDCGQAIMLIKYPNYRGLFTGEAVPPGKSMVEVESASFPTNHANIGGVLAKNWQLSDVICEAIFAHHDAPNVATGRPAPSKAGARLIAVGILADQIQSIHQSGKPH
ncbi:MAG: HDOD domain-containing protein [Betaproteobacteria bacterium]|nr:HDOD domain-containing protein [Betaproteobacteria bacterium]